MSGNGKSSSKSSTPVITRGRKASLKDTSAIEDISTLILKSEERMKAFFREELSVLTERLIKLEDNLSSVQTECARLNDEVSILKRAITTQQVQIEEHERKMRANNLIIHNIPEEDLSYGTKSVKNDSEKIDLILESSDTDLKSADIVSFRRLGKRQHGKSRPLRITLKNTNDKYQLLNSRKSISMNTTIRKTFHTGVYIGCDSSFLVQKEEYRLRQRLKEIKSEDPRSSCYIRSGALYLGNEIIDKVNVRNQLF